MKVLLNQAAGGPNTLTVEEVPAPVPGPSWVGIAVKAVGANFLDLLMIQDLYQPSRPDRSRRTLNLPGSSIVLESASKRSPRSSGS